MRRQLDNKNHLVNIDRGMNINLMPIWMIGLILWIAAKITRRKNVFSIPASISNIGRVDDRNFNCDGFTAESFFGIPPLGGDGIPAFVVTAGLAGKIDIVVRVPNRLAGNGRLDKLVEDIRKVFI